MESPLCEICAQNDDFLCAGCQKKLDEGGINHTEVEVSRVLRRLGERFSSIEEGGFRSAQDLGDMVVLVVPGGDAGKMIGKGGAIIKALEKELGKRVKVIEDGSLEEMAKELVGRNDVTGVNKVYGQDGEFYRVRIKKGNLSRLPTGKGRIEEILRAVSGEKVELVLE